MLYVGFSGFAYEILLAQYPMAFKPRGREREREREREGTCIYIKMQMVSL
jgi:hypothetical protein